MNRVVFCIFLVGYCLGILFEGQDCVFKDSGEEGKCANIFNCQSNNLSEPQICSYQSNIPVICCNETEISTESLPLRKAEKICKAYSRITYGRRIVGGTAAKPKEFQHMALLGFGNETSREWLCGGSLISKTFVLTAAHCVFSSALGDVKWVRLGELDISSTIDKTKTQDFSVNKIYTHPNYTYKLKYNDIALLKLNSSAEFGSYVKPACLHIEKDVSASTLLITGWGLTEAIGDRSSRLLKAEVKIISHEKCMKSYPNETKLNKGLLDEVQICAWNKGHDACQGDSGGPLQYKWYIYYKIVGVTSFGKFCGGRHPGVYTRVSSYLDWIEQTVWPN